MTYKAQDFTSLIGTPGFSEKLLTTHFKLYEGYVKNTNTVIEKTRDLVSGDNAGTPEYAELRRRFGWEFNGMRLHELYFGNMANGGKELEKDSDLATKMNNDFGSLDAFNTEFDAIGKMRGIGWTAMVYDPVGDRLQNIWVNEHDVGHLATTQTLLIMDVFEHAFILDYNTDRASYIEAFHKAIDWDVVSKRFAAAKKVEVPATV